MKNNRYRQIYLVLFVFLLVSACTREPQYPISVKLLNESGESSQQLLQAELGKLVNWIEYKKKWDDSTQAYIFKNTLFLDLYRNPYTHFKYSLKMLQSDDVDIKSKTLLIKVSQCLALKDYILLGKEILKTNNIVLSTVYLSPGPEFGFVIDANYQNDEVIELLSQFMAKQPSLAELIDLTLKGSTAKMYGELIDFGEKFPVVRCSS